MKAKDNKKRRALSVTSPLKCIIKTNTYISNLTSTLVVYSPPFDTTAVIARKLPAGTERQTKKETTSIFASNGVHYIFSAPALCFRVLCAFVI